MSSIKNNNFKFIPAQTLRVTSSYTIPSGYYAQVEVFFLTNAVSNTIQNITLNGTTILSNNGYQLPSALSLGMTSVTSYMVADNTGFTATPYEGLNSGKTDGGTNGPMGFGRNYQMPRSLKIWLRQGDVINGTNFGANVQLFVGDYGTVGFKPFNFQPSSSLVQSASYTIPAGKIAMVTHYFLYQTYGSISISNYPSVISLTLNGATVALINNITPFTWHKYYDSKGATDVVSDYAQKNRDEKSPVALQYWAKAGDIINGSGNWRAIVSLYDIPT